MKISEAQQTIPYLPRASSGEPFRFLPSTTRTLLPVWNGLRNAWSWCRQTSHSYVLPSRNKRLRLSETVSLGEKRFISIVEVDGHSFLIGGSAHTVSLLATFEPRRAGPEFNEVLAEVWPRGTQE